MSSSYPFADIQAMMGILGGCFSFKGFSFGYNSNNKLNLYNKHTVY